ncbi:hypothetical protein BKA64DRAFT_654925 [Cadophora sp. MPI-SDFR-AT-0126]|nr:hypothetical protein BKA64DRAFT_654925 [Leotiomycetes sp. MPI-SDFR-AT-0126]
MLKRLMALSTLIPSRSGALVGRALTVAGGREWCWHRFCPNVRLLSLGSHTNLYQQMCLGLYAPSSGYIRHSLA